MRRSAVRLREDYSVEELRALARRSKTVNQSRRLLSLAAVRDGMDRGAAAKVGGMDRQTLRDWVHRFNALGPEGLIPQREGTTWTDHGPGFSVARPFDCGTETTRSAPALAVAIAAGPDADDAIDAARGMVPRAPAARVLKISGLPNFARASSSAARQKETSIVFDRRHASTARDAQSKTATR